MRTIFPNDPPPEPPINSYLEKEFNLACVVAEYIAAQIARTTQAKFQALGQPTDSQFDKYFDRLIEMTTQHFVRFLELEHQHLLEQWRADHAIYQLALDNTFAQPGDM